MERKTMDNPMGYEPVGKLLKKFAVSFGYSDVG